MTPTLYGIPNCDTVRKARAWLNSAGIAYHFHDYKQAGIDTATLRAWTREVGWERLLNRAGTTFRALPDRDKADLDECRAIALMVAQPSLMKRPVLAGAGALVVGFQPQRYAAVLTPAD